MELDHPQTWEFIRQAGLRGQAWTHYTRVQKRALARLAAMLSRPLTVAIAGEAGSGKSTLLNALLGTAIIPAGGVGRVRPVFRARYGEEYAAFSIKADGSRHRLTSKAFELASAGQEAFAGHHSKVIYCARSNPVLPAEANTAASATLIEVHSPVPLLRDVEFIELAASFDAASLLNPNTRHFARADMAIWATPAHQAWKRSELLAWQDLRLASPDRSIIVATQKDGLAAIQDHERLFSRLTRDTAAIFKACYLVSAKQALDASARPAEAAALQNSGLPQLKNAIQELVLTARTARLARACAIAERIERRAARAWHAAIPAAPSETMTPRPANPDRPTYDLRSVR